MTNEELLNVAEIVERLVTRFHEQVAEHEAKMVEHRESFRVRTGADTERIVAAEAKCQRLKAELVVVKDDRDRLREEVIRVNETHGRTIVERDTLRAEVERLKEQKPMPPEATHDTPEGKDVAESVIRDNRKTGPADGIKVGDVGEVFQATGDITALSDIGLRGTVIEIELEDNTVRINSLAQNKDEWVDMCDVRKVTT